jgi:hypothetical protein
MAPFAECAASSKEVGVMSISGPPKSGPFSFSETGGIVDVDRNTIEGFTKRVRKNSDFLSLQFEKGADVYIVTQFTISLLGLIIFPYEALTRAGMFPKNIPLEQLYSQGWPRFDQLQERKMETFGDLVKHLRDSISHYQIEFEPPNERRLERITITFGWKKGTRDTDHRTDSQGHTFVCLSTSSQRS